jgi:hypothetical protein
MEPSFFFFISFTSESSFVVVVGAVAVILPLHRQVEFVAPPPRAKEFACAHHRVVRGVVFVVSFFFPTAERSQTHMHLGLQNLENLPLALSFFAAAEKISQIAISLFSFPLRLGTSYIARLTINKNVCLARTIVRGFRQVNTFRLFRIIRSFCFWICN